MFAALNEYNEQSYFDEHPQMYLVTPDGGYLCEIFTAFAATPVSPAAIPLPGGLTGRDDGAYTTWAVWAMSGPLRALKRMYP